MIDGTTYTPREEFDHVETGTASWYGPGFHGRPTANGERYDQNDRTAAHRTLQMPALVRVTNLENGLSTIVRINDRGPFSRGRIIDLSRAAANDIDMVRVGVARVRVEQLSAESRAMKDAALAGGGPAEQRAAAEQVTGGGRRAAPTAPQASASGQGTVAVPQPMPIPAQPPAAVQAGWPSYPWGPAVATAPTSGGFFVQTGSFSTVDNAERQRGAVRSYGASEVTQGSVGGRDVFRVRLGPYTTADAAGIVADRLRRSGYGDARVVSD